MKPKMVVLEDFTAQFKEIVNKFRHESVLVGIPEQETTREEKDAGINNATLLAINNFGSPLQNIPARPVMEIGIQNAQDQIAEEFAKAAKNALSKGLTAIDIYYERAGIIASNSIKKAINSGEGFDGPSEATLKARKAKGFSGTKSLIVTGQLRNSITYVVRGK